MNHLKLILIFSLITILITSLPASSATNDSPQSSMSTEVEQVAKMISKIAKPQPNTNVYFVKVVPGTTIKDSVPQKDVRIELKLPVTVGTYYAFWIDHDPAAFFSHEVSYGWIEKQSGKHEMIDASWPPLFDQPGIQPSPFEPISTSKIDDVNYLNGKGGGKGKTMRIKDRPAAQGPPEPYYCNPGKKTKVALVADLGDSNFFNLGNADAMHQEAELMAKYLSDNGYEVYRLSQYWQSNHPTIHYKGEFTLRPAFHKVLWQFSQAFECGQNPQIDSAESEQEPQTCCHEFFLFIVAHAKKGTESFRIYEPSGAGDFSEISYIDLRKWLDYFPTCVKLIHFQDSCFSGELLNELGRFEFEEMCDKRDCGITVMTATDEDSKTYGPNLFIDSAVEELLEGADQDYDNDGIKGDLSDRFEHLKQQNEKKLTVSGDMEGYSGEATSISLFGTPQLFLCQKGQPFCSLDTNPNPSRPPLSNATKYDVTEEEKSSSIWMDFSELERFVALKVNTYPPSANQLVSFSILDPDSNPILIRTETTDETGSAYIQLTIPQDAKKGVYQVITTTQEGIRDFVQFSITKSETQSVNGESQEIPSSIKNNAGWWSDGLIGDSDFASGIEFMIKEGIIQVPQTERQEGTVSEIPNWVRSNAGWWSNGQIEDQDFISGIQYLIKTGIIS